MTAEQLLEAACTDDISALSEQQIWIVIAQALAEQVGMTAEQLLDAACESGISSLDGQTLLVAIAEGINQGGAGPGGAVQVYEGRDPAPPDDITKPALNYPVGGGSLTQWPAGGPAWV